MERNQLWVVRRERGGPWDWTRDMRQQAGWDEHTRFMDGLVETGFVVLGGPLEGDREVLMIVDAPSEAVIRQRLAEDNWTSNGMLTTKSIERWTILLDAREYSRCLDPACVITNEGQAGTIVGQVAFLRIHEYIIERGVDEGHGPSRSAVWSEGIESEVLAWVRGFGIICPCVCDCDFRICISFEDKSLPKLIPSDPNSCGLPQG